MSHHRIRIFGGICAAMLHGLGRYDTLEIHLIVISHIHKGQMHLVFGNKQL
jgi:hypothetical protein